MPPPRLEYVDQPFYRPRHTPNLGALAALYSQGGEQLANLALQRGQNTSRALERLGALFSGYQETGRQEKAAKATMALRSQERAEDRSDKQKDREERKAERDEAARLSRETQDRAAAGRLVDDVAPGPVDDTPESRVMMQLVSRFPETAARFQRTTTLPARPVDPSMPAMDAPQPLLIRTPTGAEARAAALDSAAREREAKADQERVKDNARADANLARSIAAQQSTERHQRAMEAAAAGRGGDDDADAIADAIASGLQPPEVTGLYRLAGPVKARLARQGYDLAHANLDWKATQRHLTTLNGAQQTRVRQAIVTAADSLDVIQNLADQWKGSRFPVLNRVNLVAAKNGAYGKEAASIATQLDGQITDVTSELANVYMGGNSPTDHALSLAEKNLKADWDHKVLSDMVKLARTNLQIRRNSIEQAGPVLSTREPSTPIAPNEIVYDVNGRPVKKPE